MPCEQEDVMSLKVPEKLFIDYHAVVRLHSKLFIETFLSKFDLDPNYNYFCKGIFVQKMNAVIVSVDKKIWK